MGAIVRESCPSCFSMIAALDLLTVVPDLTLWVPRLLDCKD